MMLRSWQALLPLLVLVLAIVPACGDDPDGGGGRGLAADSVQVLNTNLGGEPQSLDPQRAADVTSITVLANIYSTLLRLDENDNIQPDLAEEIPSVDNGGISADGLTYTYKLRDDLKWDDGSDLVAQAFVDGAKRLFEPGTGNYYVDFYRVLAAGGAQGAAVAALGEGVEGDELAALEQAGRRWPRGHGAGRPYGRLPAQQAQPSVHAADDNVAALPGAAGHHRSQR